MKESSVIGLWLLYAHLLRPTESSPGGCQSRESASPIVKNVGENVQLLCSDNSTCHGTSYAFYQYNPYTGQFELIHQGSYKLTININTLDDAGKYYCINECARNATSADQHKCYWNIRVPPVLRCNINENVTMNQSINSSCTATGSPRPLIKVIISSLCKYQTELTVIDNYTTSVELTIPHVSRHCQDIYYYILNHHGCVFSKQLNIKEQISSIATDDAGNDGNKGILPTENGAKSTTMEAYVLLVTLVLVLHNFNNMIIYSEILYNYISMQ